MAEQTEWIFTQTAAPPPDRKTARIAKRLAAVPDEAVALLRTDDTAAALDLLQAADRPDPAWVEARVRNMLVAQTSLLRGLRQLRDRAAALLDEYRARGGDATACAVQEQAVLTPLEVQIARTEQAVENLRLLRENVRAAQARTDLCDDLENRLLLAKLKENLQKGGGSP